MNILKEIFNGFRDFITFTLTLNKLNDQVVKAVANYKEKTHTSVTSKWVKPSFKTEVTAKEPEKSSKGIYDSLGKMYLYDSAVLLISALVIMIFSFFWSYFRLIIENHFQSSWISMTERIIYITFQIFWRLILTMIIELINMVHIKKLTMKIHMMIRENPRMNYRQKSSKSTNPKQSHIMSRLHTYSFFITLPLQLLIIDCILPWEMARSFSRLFHNSVLYSFYSFDNTWSREGIYFEERLKFMIVHMPYFIGYGLSVGLFQMIWPDALGLGVVLTIFTYPLLVVNAYRVDWSRLHNDTVTNRRMQTVAKWMLKPSLLGCRIICAVCDKIFEYLSQ